MIIDSPPLFFGFQNSGFFKIFEMMGNRWLCKIKVLGNFQNCHFFICLQKFYNFYPVLSREGGKTLTTTLFEFHYIDNSLYIDQCQYYLTLNYPLTKIS